MAVTKIWNIKDNISRVVDYAMNPEKTADNTVLEHDLTNVLAYAENGDKTDYFYYVTGISCIPESAAEEMTITKKRYGKLGGNVAFHAYQSFKPGEVTPDICHEIGVKLAKKLWGERFEVIVATHLNTGCLHNHFVINSVSFSDGKRYNDCLESYWCFRRASDEICSEYNLSVIENTQKSATPRNIYFSKKANLPTRYNLMRQDIDNAVSRSFTESFFYRELQKMGYIVRYDTNRKYNTIQIPGTKHPTRIKTLGDNYTQEAIRERILLNRHVSNSLLPAQKIKPFNFATKSFRGLYLHYCYLLKVIEKTPHPYYSAALRVDVRKLDEYTAQTRLLCREQIDTAEQLNDFIEKTQTEINELVKDRTRTYKRISRCTDNTKLSALIDHRNALADSITKLRKDLRNAKLVSERSGEVEEKVRGEEREKARSRYLKIENTISFKYS